MRFPLVNYSERTTNSAVQTTNGLQVIYEKKWSYCMYIGWNVHLQDNAFFEHTVHYFPAHGIQMFSHLYRLLQNMKKDEGVVFLYEKST